MQDSFADLLTPSRAHETNEQSSMTHHQRHFGAGGPADKWALERDLSTIGQSAAASNLGCVETSLGDLSWSSSADLEEPGQISQSSANRLLTDQQDLYLTHVFSSNLHPST